MPILHLAGPARRPRHATLDTAPRVGRETITWFRTEDGSGLVERRRGRCATVDPLAFTALPGLFAAGEPCPPPPFGTLPIARLAARRAVLARGVSWLDGRLEAAGRTCRVALLEVEGDDALDTARALSAESPLLPACFSLAEQALALCEDRAPRPRRAGPPALDANATAEEALAGAVAHLLEVLVHESAAATAGEGPRGVHQSRVALRRLRSLVRLFRPRAPGWAEWNAGLGELARGFGAARDWDVFAAGIGAGTLAALGGDRRLKTLLRAAEGERRAAYATLAESLASPAFRLLVLEGMRLAASPPPDTTPLLPLAAHVLRKRWRRLRTAGRMIEELGAEALHEMRLDAKRLRYAAEPFAVLWPGKRARRFTRRLAALQEALGLANDAVVARGLATSLAGRGVGGFAIGAVTGFAAGRAEGSRLAAIAAWQELARTKRYWNGEE